LIDGEHLFARLAGLPTGDRLLFLAIEQRDVVTARRALDTGASPDARSAAGFPALVLAVESGDAALVRELMDRGADANARGPRDWTALDFAVMASADRDVRALLSPRAASEMGTRCD
jgi:ankyrin repeat protein